MVDGRLAELCSLPSTLLFAPIYGSYYQMTRSFTGLIPTRRIDCLYEKDPFIRPIYTPAAQHPSIAYNMSSRKSRA